MSLHAPFSTGQKNAYIRDDSLILYFDAAETPLVARFDLNSLAQANFEVIKKDDLFALVLRDFSGMQQPITTFANKADAHQALYAILQALLSYGETAKKVTTHKSGTFVRILKWLALIILGLAVAAFVLAWFSTPISQNAGTAQRPSSSVSNVPTGEPVDMDQLLSGQTQTGVAPVEATPAPAVEADHAVTPETTADAPSSSDSAIGEEPSTGTDETVKE